MAHKPVPTAPIGPGGGHGDNVKWYRVPELYEDAEKFIARILAQDPAFAEWWQMRCEEREAAKLLYEDWP